MFLDWKNQYCQNNYTTRSDLQIQYNPYKITNGICFTELEQKKKFFLLCIETQKNLNSQSKLEKEKWSWSNQVSGLQIILRTYSHQMTIVLAQNRKTDQ